ncbi:MAG: hypothetical protein R6V73_08330 [Anaerolineales bacterium]
MSGLSDEPSDFQALSERIMAVKRLHEDELLRKPNVVGVGVGYRRTGGQATRDLALVVMVSSKLPAALLGERDLIPSSIEGVLVDVQEVGKLAAQ